MFYTSPKILQHDVLFPVRHKDTARSSRLFFKNAEDPMDDEETFDALVLFRDDSEAHKHLSVLNATELGAGHYRLDFTFQHWLICVALPNVNASMCPTYYVLGCR